MYDLPSMANATKVVVDEGVVNGETKPYVIYESEGAQQAEAEVEEEEGPRPTGSDLH